MPLPSLEQTPYASFPTKSSVPATIVSFNHLHSSEVTSRMTITRNVSHEIVGLGVMFMLLLFLCCSCLDVLFYVLYIYGTLPATKICCQHWPPPCRKVGTVFMPQAQIKPALVGSVRQVHPFAPNLLQVPHSPPYPKPSAVRLTGVVSRSFQV